MVRGPHACMWYSLVHFIYASRKFAHDMTPDLGNTSSVVCWVLSPAVMVTFYVNPSACLSGHNKHLHISFHFLWQWVFTYTLPFRLCMRSRMLLESIASGLQTSVIRLSRKLPCFNLYNYFLFLAAADDRITRKEAWVCCNVDILFHKY